MSKRKKDWIIRKLKRDKLFNPFNDCFDYEFVSKEILDELGKNSQVTKADLLTGLHTIVFHKYYTGYYDFVRNLLQRIEISVEELMGYFIAIANRNYYEIFRKVLKHAEDERGTSFEKIAQYKIKSSNFLFRFTNATAVVEDSIDWLNAIFNYLKYFKNTNIDSNNLQTESEVIDDIVKIWLSSNLFYLVKESYDSAIWEEGYITKQDNQIFIKYKNEEYPVLVRIGGIRLQQNISVFLLTRKNILEHDPKLREAWTKPFKEFRKAKRIKYIKIVNGFIKYKLAKGEDKELLIRDVWLSSSIDAYYPFLGDVNLPNLTDLSVNKLLILFAEIQYLADKIFNTKIENSDILRFSDFKKFITRIKVQELKEYLGLKTKFSNKQISEFLKLLEYSNGRYDLWKKSFIKQKDYYLFPLLCLTIPKIIYLIDEWIEEGGFSLKDRGYLFENYIKRILAEELNKRNFFFNIPERKTFSVQHGNEEEIDLILETKRSVLIAEIKCIKYPMSPRNHHDAVEILKYGAKQVNRKADFLIKNKEIFQDDIGNIAHKEIVKVVITNYPIFAGLTLEGVPVIDFFLLHSYVQYCGQFLK